MSAIARMTRLIGDYEAHNGTAEEVDRPRQDRQKQKRSLLEELGRLTKILPEHKMLGITEAERTRFIAALTKMPTFTLRQIQTLTPHAIGWWRTH